MQDSLVFLFLGVGRLREDQLINVESRENVFFMIWDLLMLLFPALDLSVQVKMSQLLDK